jgi:hypothetical protein
LTLLGQLTTLGLALAGCVSFPPQQVMATRDYKGFLLDNAQQVERCGGWTGCDVALFNLVFVYAYPASPYRDARRARQYVEELQRRYPNSPWTSQGEMLLAFMRECSSLEEARRRLRLELRSREEMIRKLRGQIDRSRDIDIDIDQKERELLR